MFGVMRIRDRLDLDMNRYFKDDAGNFSIIAAVSLSAIALSIAAALDISSAHSVNADLRYSLDSATLYAASVVDSDTFEEDSVFFFHENFDTHAAVTVNSVSFTKQDGAIQAVASVNKPAFLGGLLKRDSIEMAVTSEVSFADEEVEAAPCLIALSTTANPGINLNSGAQISAPDCEVQIHSTGNSAFGINGGTTYDVKSTCVAGTGITNNTGNSIPNLETGCEVDPDPYAGGFPEPDSSVCTEFGQNYNSGGTIPLTPGVYCGWFHFNNSNANVTFAPGPYILKNGGWTVNGGNWSGDGVTFYYADDSQIQFNGGVAANFTPPTTGDFAGVFMTENPNLPVNNRQFTINDNRGFGFEGIIYLPSRNIHFNSGSSLTSLTANLIANTLSFDTVDITLESSTSASTSSSGGSVVYLSE